MRYNTLRKKGNIKALICWLKGHGPWIAGDAYWFHDGSGGRDHTCVRCGRVEGETL